MNNSSQYLDGGEKSESIRLGYSLARFLREVDTVQSHIGESTASGPIEPGAPKFLLKTGLQIDTTGTPVDILGDLSVSVERTKKFNTIKGKAPMTLIKDYIANSDEADGKELIQRIWDLESSKLLITPIKPKMACEVMVESSDEEPRAEDGKKKTRLKSSTVAMVKWTTNKEKNILECVVTTDVLDGMSGKRAKVSIEEYGKKIFLTDIERSKKSSDNECYKFIQISRHGYIKTIRVTNKMGHGLIVDNTFLYSVIEDKVLPIAYWDNRGELVGSEILAGIEKTPAFKLIKKNIQYIAQHRRYIVPNGLSEYTDIKI